MPESGQWSEAEIRAFLEKERLRYQRFELPFGLTTPGNDRSPTAERIFGGRVEGRTVLDIGSFLGFFCDEALKRGAKRAVGWELDANRVRQARTISSILGVEPEFHQVDIEEAPSDEQFDIVLCLNVLHHMRDPIATLDKLIRMTRETLVLEVASVGDHDRWKLGISRRQMRLLRRAPVIGVGRGATSRDLDTQKFFITQAALENLLEYHRNDFGRVTYTNSDFPGRVLVVAERRRVDHLVLVGGPTASGKTTLINGLRGGKLPQVEERLGAERLSEWPLTGAIRLREVREAHMPRLLFHYDFCRPFMRSARTIDRDEGLSLLKTTDRISILTLWTPAERLEKQIAARDIARAGAGLRSRIANALRRRIGGRIPLSATELPVVGGLLGRLRRYRPDRRKKALAKLYTQPERVAELYEQWFDFCDGLGDRVGQHVVVEMTDPPRFCSPKEWREAHGTD